MRLNHTFNKCLLAAFVILAICSKTSFLYPLNNWGDANVYFIQGNGILHGLVPYRDLVEHKGPIIFFIYALGQVFSRDSFVGVYLLEVLCGAGFLYYSIKILGLFADVKKYELIIAFGLAAAVYCEYIFAHGGCPEELMLLPFAYMLFLAVRYYEKDILPDTGEMFGLGICAGCMFWTKFNVCIFYISVIAFMVLHGVKNGELKDILKKAVPFIAGCIAVSAAVIVFFLVNGALSDLFNFYFYKNIFQYGDNKEMNKGFLLNMKAVAHFMRNFRNIPALILMAAGAFWMYRMKKIELLLMLSVSYAVTFFMLNSTIPEKYSNLPLSVYCLFGFCPVIAFLRNKGLKITAVYQSIIAVGCILLSYLLCINTLDILRPKSDTPQYRFAKEMSADGKDHSMLYFGFLDQGFYFASGYVPEWRAFVQLNLGGNEMRDVQRGYIDDRKPDYIVSEQMLCDTKDKDSVDGSNVEAFDDFGYEQIDEMSFEYEEADHLVRLYKKVENY